MEHNILLIEIAQELTVVRQAFEATMRITNSLDNFRLEDIKVTLTFEDENSDPVVATSNPNHNSATFFVRLDDHRGIQSVATGEAGAITDISGATEMGVFILYRGLARHRLDSRCPLPHPSQLGLVLAKQTVRVVQFQINS